MTFTCHQCGTEWSDTLSFWNAYKTTCPNCGAAPGGDEWDDGTDQGHSRDIDAEKWGATEAEAEADTEAEADADADADADAE